MTLIRTTSLLATLFTLQTSAYASIINATVPFDNLPVTSIQILKVSYQLEQENQVLHCTNLPFSGFLTINWKYNNADFNDYLPITLKSGTVSVPGEKLTNPQGSIYIYQWTPTKMTTVYVSCHYEG